MINHDQLTEALARWEHWTPDLPGAQGVGRDFDVVLEAARLLLTGREAIFDDDGWFEMVPNDVRIPYLANGRYLVIELSDD